MNALERKGTALSALELSKVALDALHKEFPSSDAQAAIVARAPGRINVLGEHTDYNDGFVLPAATSQAIYVAAAPRKDQRFRVWSEAFGSRDEFLLDKLDSLRGEEHWASYVRAVAWALAGDGFELRGVDAAIIGDLPVGGGAASSAAVEVAFALALLAAAGASLDDRGLARLCQRAENEFVGMHCGILDQATSVFARDGAAMLMDCRTLDIEPIPLGSRDVVFVVCDTAKPRELVDTEYNVRREQCEQAAACLGLKALRDASLEQLQAHRSQLGELVFRRARHVVTENARVLEGAKALRNADFVRLGELLRAAHDSLRDDYEVSCPELDAMVDIAREAEGCFGARLMGAGFGGCALAAVEASRAETFQTTVEARYRERTGLMGRTFATHPAEGAGLIDWRAPED